MRLDRLMLVAVGLLIAAATPYSEAAENPLEPQFQQTKQVIGLVNKAATLVARKGEEAFPAFKKKGGR